MADGKRPKTKSIIILYNKFERMLLLRKSL